MGRSQVVLILMPSAPSYGLAVLALNAVGASTLASRFQAVCPKKWHLSFSTVYIGVLAAIALWGGFVFNCRTIIGIQRAWLLSVPVGLVCGLASTVADRALTHWFMRQSARERALNAVGRTGPFASAKRVADPRVVVTSQPSVFVEHGFGLWPLITVAALEEIVHRGWILHACLMLPATSCRVVAMVLAFVFFALIHLRFGWCHVAGKFALGVLAFLSMTISGSVIAAITTHIWFNTKVWQTQSSGNQR